ncbi:MULTISPECIES: flavin prenyltransferase UbiX [Shewanella]|uniref:Flavin prenyltransferase UbiX n=1 Tax=Shewanella fidelis TaxID=173509 RepID=A0AAW8NPN3_9GAMM|nr:UbiX family flavin prenyltransferase [Shewanella fidelis]MDW4811214.1 UbiX family flavin prenyltransferase [Shewanella fidelis]MDW4815007.1 UbiX family flavin prenyltransferase [Shewanella fidelis]MDW4819097.1 UbiX family flavin prenyltransferase [Shewanella fidelis]MDW4823225.1 UbiX family flavin prenyltransferase [Shewanella fidelis]
MSVKYRKAEKSISLAWTGASGAPYGLRLLEILLQNDYQVFLMISSAARVVLATEQGLQLSANSDKAKQQLLAQFNEVAGELIVLGKEEWFSPPASGSAAPKQMVICPCSTGTLAAVATGMSNNLLERAADVVIKERGQLILVPRETPFSAIHLEHMLSLSKLGATIMPAAPGFYHNPKSVEDLVDFMVARILDHLGVNHALTNRWGYDKHNVSDIDY